MSAGIGQVTIVGSLVSLAGTAIDAEEDPLTLEWALTSKPVGSSAELFNANTLTPSFVPDLAGSYVARLIASDFIGAGLPDEVYVIATTAATYAAAQTQAANALLAALPSHSVINGGNQRALSQFLAAAIVALDAGDLSTPCRSCRRLSRELTAVPFMGHPMGMVPDLIGLQRARRRAEFTSFS